MNKEKNKCLIRSINSIGRIILSLLCYTIILTFSFIGDCSLLCRFTIFCGIIICVGAIIWSIFDTLENIIMLNECR